MEELASAYVDPRLKSDYFPNLAEWLTNVGTSALFLIVFSLGYLLLPIVGRPVPERTP
jgi:hypothetical protein